MLFPICMHVAATSLTMGQARNKGHLDTHNDMVYS